MQPSHLTNIHDITVLQISPHTHLDIPEAFFKERQHLGELVVRVHVVGGAAALLQQLDDVLVLDLLVDLELLEGGTQSLEERAEIIVVGEVRLRQLRAKRERAKKDRQQPREDYIKSTLHHSAVEA